MTTCTSALVWYAFTILTTFGCRICDSNSISQYASRRFAFAPNTPMCVSFIARVVPVSDVLAQVHRPLLSDADLLPHDVLVRESRVEIDERDRALGRGRARGGRAASHRVVDARAARTVASRLFVSLGARRSTSRPDASRTRARATRRDARRARAMLMELQPRGLARASRRRAAPRRATNATRPARAREKVTFSSSSSPRRSPPRAPSTPPRRALC